MSDGIETARGLLDGIPRSPDIRTDVELAKTYALLAIAEQLRALNHQTQGDNQ